MKEKQISALIVLAAVIIAGFLFFFGAVGRLFPIPGQGVIQKLPADFPKEFLAFGDGKFVAMADGGGIVSVVLSSRSDPKEILEKLSASMQAKGWNIIAQTNEASYSHLYAILKDKHDFYTAEFQILGTSSLTEVHIKYGKQLKKSS